MSAFAWQYPADGDSVRNPVRMACYTPDAADAIGAEPGVWIRANRKGDGHEVYTADGWARLVAGVYIAAYGRDASFTALADPGYVHDHYTLEPSGPE